jgi:GNAT superfamily N-acetyltransferase
VYFTGATNDTELQDILILQRANYPEHLTKEERIQESFVSARHTLDLLREMNCTYPHVIAKETNKAATDTPTGSNGRVVGYTLCLLRTFDVKRIPALEGLLDILAETRYLDKPLDEYNYIIMGQVCVAKEYRGQGIFVKLYETMRDRLSSQYECIVTAVSSSNPRSLRAHEKIGFQTVHVHPTEGHDWIIVLWDWKR